jgi:hypothetical protein
MFACTIAGAQYLLVSNGKEIWSVTAAGAVNKIGEGFTAGSKWSMVQAPTTTAKASQGPVYMVNGVDKPQYWTGAEAKTVVAEWTGVGSATELTDGVLTAATSTIKSETAGFISSDVGLICKFAEGHKYLIGAEEPTIVEPIIEAVLNSKEAVLALPAEARGWKETQAAVHFTIERAYYEKGKHVPNGQFMVFFGNRIWMTGIKEDPSAVWFSELASIGEGGAQADPSQWPRSNVVRFDSSDGHSVTGIGEVGPYLGVFKESKTWIIHDVNSGANRRLSDTIGCVSHRSIVETNSGTFFLTADQGVYLTDGTHLHEMSYNVRPTILSVNPAQRANAAGWYFNNHYYLSFATGAESKPNRTLDYDVQLKSWWLHDLTANQWAQWTPTAGKPTLVSLPPKVSGGVAEAFKEGVYTDLGAVYTGKEGLAAYFKTNWEPFSYYVFRHRIKAPMLKKRMRGIFFNGEGQIAVAVYKNFLAGGRSEPAVVGNNEIATSLENPTSFSAAEAKWAEGSGEWGVEGAEALWGGEASVGSARLYALGTANLWSVAWGNNSAEPFIVDAFVYQVQFRKS